MSIINNETINIENETNEEIKANFMKYSKLYQRILRNGNIDTVKKAGRKQVSPEHKKATYERTLERRKKERAEKAAAEGRKCVKGRPRLSK